MQTLSKPILTLVIDLVSRTTWLYRQGSIEHRIKIYPHELEQLERDIRRIRQTWENEENNNHDTAS